MRKRKVLYSNLYAPIAGDSMGKLADVEIVRDGDIFYARITLPDGTVTKIESENFEEILNQVATELQDIFGFL